MIRTFKCKETKQVFQGISSRKFPRDIQKRALIKLRMIDASKVLTDLKSPPSNFLELLKGNRKGCYSIRVNDQWRICFKWKDNEAYEVEICDYH